MSNFHKFTYFSSSLKPVIQIMWIVILIIVGVVAYNFLLDSPKKKPANTLYSPRQRTPSNFSQPRQTEQKKIRSKNKLPDGLVITQEFKEAFDLMETTQNCAYITGKAGTGKSTLLTYFRQKTKKNVIVLAPTGIAAINVEGSTIHSFFKFVPKLIEKKDISKDYKRQDVFNKVDMIVIDEISMVRADLLDGIDYSLRINRNTDIPFGGVQMIFFGDLYQLPPVVVGKDLTEYFNEHYGGYYFFNAKVFSTINFKYIELQTIFRQKDNDFKNILNNIRENRVSQIDLATLNKRYQPNCVIKPDDVSLTLTTTNKISEDVNREKMANLKGVEQVFHASISGRFDKGAYPTESILSLKSKAQVMLLKNDSQKRWVNGTIGIITHISNNSISVEVASVTYLLEKATWEVIEYEYNREEKKIEAVVIGSFTQYPLKPAWAITIHKSQGQTFDNVIIDLGSGAFAHGQTYVALSRCTSLEGIILKTLIKQTDIISDSKVTEFIEKHSPKLMKA